MAYVAMNENDTVAHEKLMAQLDKYLTENRDRELFNLPLKE